MLFILINYLLKLYGTPYIPLMPAILMIPVHSSHRSVPVEALNQCLHREGFMEETGHAFRWTVLTLLFFILFTARLAMQ
jgi:hypothetical protein